MKSFTPAMVIIDIVNKELTELMGGQNVKLAQAAKPPTVVLMAGLQGAGKTTLTGKLAKWLKERQHKPLMVAGDIYRPAAIRQLEVLGEQIGVPVFSLGDGTSPVEIARRGVEHARSQGCDYVLIDTAGRLQIDDALMEELRQIRDAVRPDEVLLVVDAMTGQEAVNVAQSFHEQLALTGVVLTKLDGDTRGGAALSVKAVTGCPIKFASTGEEMERKMREASFTLDDFVEQMEQLRKLGPLEQLLDLVPGMGQLKNMPNFRIDERQVVRTLAIVRSMTKEERQKPEIINFSRRKRIAAGSGTSVADVNRLLKQFEDMKKMMKRLSGMMGPGGKGPKGMKALRNMLGPRHPGRFPFR